ncbi:MAG: diguanylate cyclase [Gammaproteobacteria bacterium]|nr:diguanylate cyclase [Gammaproteobacteria bacterium]MBU1555112.1 diguanylate cyclase [Gammaproteobacteria bacterium]MBU2069514.1 diguanylate cyclase [Gammaproteobacteria bacterium]MBU2183018.1 diguanylate cyclase [Gammaproteobacteria bacterium]MBU2206663.1 diguanylate cyclase [Gammaproteobacteria bacterium]
MNTESYKALSNYIDLLLDAICVVDKFGRFEFVSAGAERIFGYTPEEMLGRPMIELVHPDDRQRTLKAAAEINAGVVKIDFENRYIRKDGQIVHLLWSARWSATDKRRVAVARDISRSKIIEARQRAVYAISEAAFACDDLAALYQSIQQIIAGLVPMQRFAILLAAKDSAQLEFVHDARLSAMPEADNSDNLMLLCHQVMQRCETINLQQQEPQDLPAALRQQISTLPVNWLGLPLKSQTTVIGVLMVHNAPTVAPYSQSEIELLEFVSVQVAVAIERKQMLQHLQRNALYDQLTGLPNRELFDDRVRSAMARAQREQGQFALLYLDLDKFKQVNDLHGHQVGDELLQHTAQRILTGLRHSDTVARFGGDEFVILLEQVDSADSAMALAEKVRSALESPFALAGHLLQVLPSIGVALYPSHSQDIKALLLLADNAMYQAKSSGGNRVQLNQHVAPKRSDVQAS